MRLYLASRVSTKNETMAPLHVATLTVKRELFKYLVSVGTYLYKLQQAMFCVSKL